MSDRQQFVNLILDHAERPRNYGPLAEADVVMTGGGGECGDTVKIYMRREGDRIASATFEAEGTTIGRAAASITTEIVIGMTLAEVKEMLHDTIVETMGREVVGDRLRSATLPLDTVKAAARKLLAAQKLLNKTAEAPGEP